MRECERERTMGEEEVGEQATNTQIHKQITNTIYVFDSTTAVPLFPSSLCHPLPGGNVLLRLSAIRSLTLNSFILLSPTACLPAVLVRPPFALNSGRQTTMRHHHCKEDERGKKWWRGRGVRKDANQRKAET